MALISKKEKEELRKVRTVIKKVNDDAKKPKDPKKDQKAQDQQPQKPQIIVVTDESDLDKMLEDVGNNDLSNKVIKETDKAIKEADATAANKPANATKKRVPFTSVSADADVDDIDDDVPEEYTEDDSSDTAKPAADTTKSADTKEPATKAATTDAKQPDPAKDSKKTDDKKADKSDSQPYAVIVSAYSYAETEALNDDMQKAISTGFISDDLRKCLEILVDNERFRQFILTQCEVKRKEAEPQFVLDHKYVDVNGDGVPDVVIKALGNRDLGEYNINLKVIHRDIKTKKEIGEATEAETKKYIAELEKAKGGKKASSANE